MLDSLRAGEFTLNFLSARRGFHCISPKVKVNVLGIPQFGRGGEVSNDWCIRSTMPGGGKGYVTHWLTQIMEGKQLMVTVCRGINLPCVKRPRTCEGFRNECKQKPDILERRGVFINPFGMEFLRGWGFKTKKPAVGGMDISGTTPWEIKSAMYLYCISTL